MAMRTFMNRSDTAPCQADCPDNMRGQVALAPRSIQGPERGRPALAPRSIQRPERGRPALALHPTFRFSLKRWRHRLRAALSFTAALAVAAALGGCSTFGVSPFPEPIRPPIEAEGEDTAAPEAQAEEAGRYSPTPGVRITRT